MLLSPELLQWIQVDGSAKYEHSRKRVPGGSKGAEEGRLPPLLPACSLPANSDFVIGLKALQPRDGHVHVCRVDGARPQRRVEVRLVEGAAAEVAEEGQGGAGFPYDL